MTKHVLAKNLKESILESALQGKLTKRFETDTLVDKTIALIVKDKKTLLSKKDMKDRLSFFDISNDEIPFIIPAEWKWLRINDIGIYKKGPFGSALTKNIFVPKGNNTVKVYEQKNAIQKDWQLGEYYISKEYYEKSLSSFKVEPGDIIVSCAGTIGETYVMPNNAEHGIINQALMRINISKNINIDYFLLFFDHVLKEESRKNSFGSAIKNIPPFDKFKAMLIPIPPIEEQQRIVDKVDELMAKIDEYEKIENQLVELKKDFPANMKDSILQAAIQGKLSKQKKKENVALDKADIIKKKETEYLLFDIPRNWESIHLEDITNSISIKPYQIKESEVEKNGINKVVSQSKDNIIGYSNKNDKLYKHNKPVVIFGDHTTIVKLIDFDFIVGADGVKIFEPKYNVLLPEYLEIVLKYYCIGLDKVGGYSRHYKFIKDKPIPLPPIEEQQRIVELLDKLLPLCEQLMEA